VASFDFPSSDTVTMEGSTTRPAWLQWFSLVHTTIISLRQSGTTTKRPTSGLWIGRTYFDTTLSKPIWVKTSNPVVWVDATGASV
jgi:hypothetical protein